MLPPKAIKDGTVTLYTDIHFHGAAHQFPVKWMGKCYNLNSCHDDNSGSVKWKGLPTNGSFDNKAHIRFYSNLNCVGFYRDWTTDAQENNVPGRLMIDTLYNKVSSVKVYADTVKRFGVDQAKCT